MRAVQVTGPGGDLELVERPVPEPGPGQVRVRVQACGICHSDAFTVEGLFPGIDYPRVPGHEVAGVVDAVGADVEGWTPGRRAGVGWFGGNCGRCEPCRRGDAISCEVLPTPGIHYDGGWASHLVVPATALAAIPDELADADAAPLLCAGVTTFNGLRANGVRPGDTVAVLGLGGLGHLGVQYAARMGCRTIAIARGAEKGELARELGAHAYVDSTAQDPAQALTALGGADAVLATVTSADAMAATFEGLRPRGRLIVLGASTDPIAVSPLQLIMGSRTVTGHASGTAKDSEDTLAFSALAAVAPRVETFPLERAREGYDRMMSGDARFRVVLTVD